MSIRTSKVVLDHGYVSIVESWGTDEGIIEAARMSTGKGFLGWGPWMCPMCRCEGSGEFDRDTPPKDCMKCGGTGHVPGDEKLLRYLWSNKHSTPFEMAGMTIEVKAPIFVFRQWHRHRTQSYNEMSARYTPLPDENYMPTVERMLTEASANKQANRADGSMALDENGADRFLQDLRTHYELGERIYHDALARGVPKEIARVHLPVARYSRMRASANLRNWLGFLTLRMDAHAQYEIRVYAEAVGALVAERFPRTWELFMEGLG